MRQAGSRLSSPVIAALHGERSSSHNRENLAEAYLDQSLNVIDGPGSPSRRARARMIRTMAATARRSPSNALSHRGVLQFVEPEQFQGGAEFFHGFGGALPQCLADGPVRGAPVGVADFAGDVVVATARNGQLDGVCLSPGGRRTAFSGRAFRRWRLPGSRLLWSQEPESLACRKPSSLIDTHEIGKRSLQHAGT
jgi:hypothetical protein